MIPISHTTTPKIPFTDTTSLLLVEWIGYVGRAISATQSPNWALGPFLDQTLLLLVAPGLFAASIYMQLGRIILATDGEKYSLIRRTWLTKVFVTGDVLSFGIQAAGKRRTTRHPLSTDEQLHRRRHDSRRHRHFGQ